jgi:hypothetical protein
MLYQTTGSGSHVGWRCRSGGTGHRTEALVPPGTGTKVNLSANTP